ncbi:hypothetical protein K3495_g11265 [Podosphaera aphanis]|nr:hypothetical protein K3495_g11265 [Podosphaera aphanis]
MKQGKYQPFSEYLRDFEYTLAQAKGLNWEDRIKINDLYRGLNDRLTRALFPIEVSESDYTLFVNQVRGVAGRIEAYESHTVNHPQSLTRTIFDENYSAPRNSTVGNREALGSSRESNSTMLDSEGDTPMSGVNGISLEKLAALVNAVNAKSNGQESNKNERPPAPWRSPEEFSALRAAGKCTRCGKKGHWYKKCPQFTWARRPTGLNATFSSPGKRPSSEGQEFGYVSGNDSGKE